MLVEASEFAAAAAGRLAQEGSSAAPAPPQLLDDYVDMVFGLEVHFVFPNLSAEQRDLLVAIMKVRNSISAVLNGASRADSAKEKVALGKQTADLEQKFLEFRNRIVESGIEAELDPIQKKIFQDEFFSITLDKRGSTTLFFRTDATPRPGSGAGWVRVQESDAAAGKSDHPLPLLRDGMIPFAPSKPEGLVPHSATQAQAESLSDRSVVSPNSDITPAQPELAHRVPVVNATPDLAVIAPPQSVIAQQVPDIASQGPVVAPQMTDIASPVAEPRMARQRTVLLISDDSGAQDLVRQALRQAGHNLLLSNAGFSGYAIAMRERPDLVMVDLSLASEVSGPDACLDGKGVLKMLSKLPTGRALPFLGLVYNGSDETEAQVLASGARACLQKPLDPRLVLDAVQKAWGDAPSETEEAAVSA